MKKGELPLSEIANHPFYPNQFVVMKDALGGSSSALGIVDHLGKKVKKLIFIMNKYGEYDHEMCSKLWD